MTSRRARPEGWHLYVVLDRSRAKDDSELVRIAEAAARGGADALQLRYKTAKVSEITFLGRRLMRVSKKFRIPLIINDRIEAALASDADGLHISGSDMSVSLARRMLGRRGILGVSASRIKDIREAREKGADYIGCGPVFKTPIKIKKRPLKYGFIKQAMRLDIPIIFIGGINLENAAQAARAGIRRIAVIRAIANAGDPYKTAVALKRMMMR